MTTAIKERVSLKKVGYVILYVKDTKKAVPFYRDILGIPVRMDEQGWVELETAGFTLALHGCEGKLKALPETAPTVVFQVPDIRAAHKALKEQGLKIKALNKVCEFGDQVGLSGEFNDPDGNRLSVYGMVAKADWKG